MTTKLLQDDMYLAKICSMLTEIEQQEEPAMEAAARAAFASIRQEWGSFDRYLWHWTEGKTICERDRTTSPLSDAISADLRRRGMSFVGSTIIYAYLQAVGVLWSHEEGCFLQTPPCQNP